MPLYDEVGMPGTYLKSGIWANYNFRVNKPFVLRGDFGKLNLKKGLSRYAAFWAHENNVDISNSEFEILMKPIEAQFTWKKDLLEDNLKKPWVNVGTINWLNKKATVHLNVNKQIKSN